VQLLVYYTSQTNHYFLFQVLLHYATFLAIELQNPVNNEAKGGVKEVVHWPAW
jgi:hypothetical protein